MFVKKFIAPTLEDALRLVKKEFGDHALILSSVTQKGTLLKKGHVEVTAAQEKQEKPEKKQALTQADLEKLFPHRKVKEAPPKVQKEESPVRASRYIDIAPAPDPVRVAKKRASSEQYEDLFLRVGICQESARDLAHRLVMDYPKSELDHPVTLEKLKVRLLANGMKTVSPEFLMNHRNYIAMGPPGSGKTSYLVKLSLFLKERGMKTVLASRERRKITGAGEMAQYAKILKVPFAHDLKEKNRDRSVLVDVSAVSARGEGFKEDMERLLMMLERPSPILVVDATQRLKELMYILEGVHRFNPVAVAFTKVDLACNLGGVYDFLRKSRLPLLSLSVSESFRSSLQFFNQLDLAGLILGTKAQSQG